MVFKKQPKKIRNSTDLLRAKKDPDAWLDPFEGRNIVQALALRPIHSNYYWALEINNYYIVFYKTIWIRAWFSKNKARKFVDKHNQKIKEALIKEQELPNVPKRIGEQMFGDISHYLRNIPVRDRWDEKMHLLNQGISNQPEREFLLKQGRAGVQRQFIEYENTKSMPWLKPASRPILTEAEQTEVIRQYRQIHIYHQITRNQRYNLNDCFDD